MFDHEQARKSFSLKRGKVRIKGQLSMAGHFFGLDLNKRGPFCGAWKIGDRTYPEDHAMVGGFAKLGFPVVLRFNFPIFSNKTAE